MFSTNPQGVYDVEGEICLRGSKSKCPAKYRVKFSGRKV